MKIGIVGASPNSRGPVTLTKLVEQTGATPAATTDTANQTQVVILAVPRRLFAQIDHVIPPDAERCSHSGMRADTIEVASGHGAMISHPQEMHERIVGPPIGGESLCPGGLRVSLLAPRSETTGFTGWRSRAASRAAHPPVMPPDSSVARSVTSSDRRRR